MLATIPAKCRCLLPMVHCKFSIKSLSSRYYYIEFLALNFKDFNFEKNIQEGLDDMGFETPTPIQEQAIPIIMSGRDLIGCAQTGTGKTAAFLLPILNKLSAEPSDHTDTLIIVPTRELALQIYQALQGFSYHTSINSQVVYGGGDGADFEQEKKSLQNGANIVIATPGRLISHLNMGYVKWQDLKHLVLDEADRMLDMGFVDDIMKVITFLPKKRQTLLFSATMHPKIRQLASKLLHEPEQISLAVSKPAEGVTQNAYLVYNAQKNSLTVQILKEKKLSSVIIFSGTKLKVKELERDLQKVGINARAIHSDLDQQEREEVLRSFRSKKLPVLVATDILSRGIDVEDIGLVINYDVPGDAEDYIHRIGRTARAETTGEAITFINDLDQRKFSQIETFIGAEIAKLPLPGNLPKGPDYNPSLRVKSSFHHGSKKGFKGKKFGGKN